MNLDDQFDIEHLLFAERICRYCGLKKNLIDDFYKTRKNKIISSSYSYECKECTIKRITKSRYKNKKIYSSYYEYPDW